jgi:hypothetical protein
MVLSVPAVTLRMLPIQKKVKCACVCILLVVCTDRLECTELCLAEF